MLDIILTIVKISVSIYLYVYAPEGNFALFSLFCPQKSLLYLQNTIYIATLQQILLNFLENFFEEFCQCHKTSRP